jgi:Cytochrome C oxidase, cbb3-type, subunit III
VVAVTRSSTGSPPFGACDSPNYPLHWHHAGPCNTPGDCDDYCGTMEGTYYWLRTPEQEKRVVTNLYNRYCLRCHGVDGRGVWDIPDVPNFTNAAWQASRSDDQLARITIEGRGAVMPAFRGTLTLEESWAMARYLRTFVPGTEVSPPGETPAKPASPTPAMPSSAPKNDKVGSAATSPSLIPPSPISTTKKDGPLSWLNFRQ